MGIGIKIGIDGQINNNIVTDGLVYSADPAYQRSYISGSQEIFNLASGSLTPTGSFQDNGMYDSDHNGTMAFDGVDDYIILETPILDNLSNVSTFSICQWAKPKIGNDFGTMGYVNSHPASRMNFGTWNNSNVIYNIGQTGGSTGQAIYRAYSNWDNWSYWVCTFDTSLGSKAERLRGYIDGVDPGSWTDYGADGSYNTGTITQFWFGYVGMWSSYMLGSVGPVQIYNRALSESEVLQNFNAQKDRFGL